MKKSNPNAKIGIQRIIQNDFGRIVIEVALDWNVKPVMAGLPHRSTEVKLTTKIVTYEGTLKDEL